MGATFGDSGNSGYFYIFEPHKEYLITKFQRGYTWGDYQTKGLIDDIEYIQHNGRSVGWPSILIQQEEESSSPNISLYSLGDGQQRLTTVAILLLAIWQRGRVLISIEDDSINSSNKEFLNKIVSLDKTGGMIARSERTNRGIQTEASIKFQDDTTDKAFARLCHELNANDWEEMDKETRNKGATSKLYGAFQKFYDYLIEKSMSMNDLENLFNLISKNITLTVLSYAPSDDMQRSFSNMNSFGVSLEENELIKADIFGKIRSFDKDLANDIADYWTDNLTKDFWKEERKTGDGNKIVLDYVLEQIYNSYDNWDKNDRTDKIKNPHWLRDSWRKQLESLNEDNVWEFWENLQKDFDICEAIFDNKQSHHPGSLNWEISYNHQIYTNCRATNFLSFMLKIKRKIDESNHIDETNKDTEFISILQTYSKYFISIILYAGETSHVSSNISNFLDKDFESNELNTYEGTLKFLRSMTGISSKWYSYDELRNRISSMSYGSRANMLINEAFVYVLNQERIARGDRINLLNTRTLKEFHKIVKNREHILPQKPNGAKSDAEYDFLVGKLGNTLILSGSDNQIASNKPIEKKVKDYRNANGLFDYWIKEFLDYYEKNGFGEDDIEIRTMLLADRFAKVLAPKDPNPVNPHSKFKGLIETHGAGSILYIKTKEGEWDEVVVSEDGGIIIPNKEIVYNTEDLYKKALLESQTYYWKQYLFEKKDGKYSSLHSNKKK